jgi:hypothetical protein
MTTVAEVILWGNTIGAVSLEENNNIASFQYEPSYLESEIELSPIIQMSINNKRDNFCINDFKECAKTASMKRGRAEKIIDEVKQAVAKWKEFAKHADVDPTQQDKIQTMLRISDF